MAKKSKRSRMRRHLVAELTDDLIDMARKSKKMRPRTRRHLVAELTDDLIVDILSRLPAKSVCRCKCVSRRWRDLISDPDHRKNLPQTLAGFFYSSEKEGRFPKEARHFVNATGRGQPLIYPSFSFLPRFERIRMVDSCGGLLLCRCFLSSDAFRYVVCNPSTEEWVALPESGYEAEDGELELCTRLGFDPAFSFHFYVFEFVMGDFGNVAGVKIYSSETGMWNYRKSGWCPDMGVSSDQRSVFFNGMLHLVINPLIVVVDVKGETWLDIPLPELEDTEDVEDEEDMRLWMHGFICQSQGKLYYLSEFMAVPLNMSIWVLEDYSKDEWTLMHNVTTEQLSEKTNNKYKTGKSSYYHVVTVHPDCNLIYYIAGRDHTLMAYDMDRKESHVIQDLGSDCMMEHLPYVPFYEETLFIGC